MKRSLPILALLLSAAVSHAWDLKPDPPADKPWTPQPDLDVRVERFSVVVGFAEQNGPFVVVQRPDRRREVFDLRTGQAVAKYTPLAGTGRELLSPGGTLSAIASGAKTVRLLEVATGKERPAVTVDGGVSLIAFSSDAQLAVVGVNAGKRYVALFDTATGKETARHPIDPSPYEQFPAARPLAVSPGGKHLAVRCGDSINVYDLADGKKMATLELPELTPGVNRQPGPVGIAFSADGRELAAVVRKAGAEAGTLIVWGTTDGTKSEHAVGQQTSPEPVLAGGWVVGAEVLKDGKKTPLLLPNALPGGVRTVVSPSQVILLDNRGQNHAIRTFGGSGGAGTPSGAKEVPTDAAAGWTGLTVGKVPRIDDLHHRLVMLGDIGVPAITLPLDGRMVFVECGDEPTPGKGARTVKVIDPVKMGVPHTHKLAAGRYILGDAATSEAFLTCDAPTDPTQKPRLELLAADGRSLGGWSPPFADGPPKYAAVASTTRVVTVGAGRVTAWQLPEGKAVWTAAFPDADGGGLSPDGKVLFVAHPGGVRAMDVETGGTLGNLTGGGGPLGGRGRGHCRLAFGGDGRRVAVMYTASRTVRVWDLSTGVQVASLSPSHLDETSPLRFFGSRWLLAGEVLFDLTDRREVWRLKATAIGSVVAGGGPADGRIWYSSSMGSSRHLAWVCLPDNQLTRFVADYDRTGDAIFQKGEKVRLVIEPPADAPPGWDAQARTAARLALTSAKLTEDAAAPTVVKVTFTTVPGESMKMKWQGAENLGREETIKKFSVERRTEVTRDGRVVWTAPPSRTEMRIRQWPAVNEINDDSTSGQEFFARQVWKGASSGAGSVFASAEAGIRQPNGLMWRLPGQGTLDSGELKMNWPAGHEPSAEPIAVEGDPSVTPKPPAPTGAVGASAWVLWVVGGGCGGLLLAAGAVVLVVVLAAKRRKKLDDERPRKTKRTDDEDDRPRQRR